MKYYRVKKDSHDFAIYGRTKNNSSLHLVATLVKNELLTEKLLSKWGKSSEITPNFIEKHFEEVSASQKNIYWFFGCRFEIGKGYSYKFNS